MNLAEYQSECEGRAPVEVLSKRWNPFLDHAEVDLRPEENV
jgi:hypothetical protein